MVGSGENHLAHPDKALAVVGPSDLNDLAEEFLAACVEALDTIPTFDPGLGGAPGRSYVAPGLPAFDNCCEDQGQLTVHVASVIPSPQSPLTGQGVSARAALVTVASLVATIVRCVPTGEQRETAATSAASEQINADGWALWNHVLNMIRAGDLFTQCGEVFWDGLRSINPSGGCGGYTLNLRVLIDGYQEA